MDLELDGATGARRQRRRIADDLFRLAFERIPALQRGCASLLELSSTPGAAPLTPPPGMDRNQIAGLAVGPVEELFSRRVVDVVLRDEQGRSWLVLLDLLAVEQGIGALGSLAAHHLW